MKILDLRGTWRCRTDEAACFIAPDGRWEGTPLCCPALPAKTASARRCTIAHPLGYIIIALN